MVLIRKADNTFPPKTIMVIYAILSFRKTRVSYQSIPMELLETKIRQLVEERLGSVTTFPQTNTAVPEQVEHVSQDIVDMLGDLELFQI